MQTTAPTTSPTFAPTLFPTCLTTYIYCGEGASTCPSGNVWAIDLTAFDSDNGDSLTCTVRIGSGRCEPDDDDPIDLGVFEIGEAQMELSILSGFAPKDFRIVSSSTTQESSKPNHRFLATGGNIFEIPLGINEFADDFISILVTICNCDASQEGCGTDEPDILPPTLTPTQTAMSSESPSAPPSAVNTVLNLEGPDTQAGMSEPWSIKDKTASKPRVALIVTASSVFLVALLLLTAFLCARRRRKTTIIDGGDADSDSSIVSKDENLAPWSDVEL